MKNIIVKPGEEIALGKRGENLARCAVFDISDWVTTYGEGTVHLLHQRNGDKIPYPCVVEMENGLVCWVITNTETEIAGRGLVELQYWVDETIAKSATYNTRVAKSMGVAGDVPPEPAENWLETMLGLGTEVSENATVAAESAVSAAASAAEAAESAATAVESVTEIQTVIEGAISNALDSIEKSVTAAGNYADSAEINSKAAQISADSAAESATDAESAKQAAEDAKAAAEKARDEAQTAAGGDFVSRGGDTMRGPLTLSGDPTEAKQAATKQYVDAVEKTADNHISNKNNPHGVTAEQVGALAKSGGEIDGTLTVTGQISAVGLISSDAGITTAGDIITGRNVTATKMYADAYYNGNGDRLTETFTATVTTDWLADDANGGYLQMVELDGILATDNPIPDVILGDDIDANKLYKAAWSLVDRIVTEDDMVTLYANGEAPTTAFTMQLKVVR